MDFDCLYFPKKIKIRLGRGLAEALFLSHTHTSHFLNSQTHIFHFHFYLFIEIQKVQMVKYMIGAKEIMVNVNTGFTVRAPPPTTG